jgi:hypothetical protein
VLFAVIVLKSLRNFLGRRTCLGDAGEGGRHDLFQALGADRLADRLLGFEELVDVGLREADGLGQVGDCRLAIAEAREVGVGGVDDLLADGVVGRPAAARGGVLGRAVGGHALIGSIEGRD